MTRDEILSIFKRAKDLEVKRLDALFNEKGVPEHIKKIVISKHISGIAIFAESFFEAADHMRGFEVAKGFANISLPKRSTFCSAGYDFFAASEAEIMPGGMAKIDTGVKAYMGGDEVLKIYPRSSYGIKRSLVLANSTAVIDSDYYENPSNDGHIIIALHNYGPVAQKIEVGDKIAQGIFSKFLDCGDTPEEQRTGGIGSTDKA